MIYLACDEKKSMLQKEEMNSTLNKKGSADDTDRSRLVYNILYKIKKDTLTDRIQR